MHISRIFLILSLIALSGCQTQWTRIDAKAVSFKGDHYAVDLPSGWLRLQQNKIMLVTRDGIGVQNISFVFHQHEKAFEKTEQKSTPDMLPSELADRYVADLRAAHQHGLPSLEIISNRPITIAGRLAFELHLQFLNDDGLRYERLATGFTNTDGFFIVSYQAPSLHFFERDRASYQKVLQTFRPI